MKRIIAAAIVTASVAISSGCDNTGQRLEKYLLQGDTYLQQNNLDKARISYKNALQIDPENINAKLKFAEVLERVEDFKGAFGLYMGILEKEPQNIVALERQGKILMMARETDKAMENAEKLITIKGADYAPALTLKAGVLSAEGKMSESLALAERANQLAPDNIDTNVLLASLYMRQASFADAERVLRQAINAHPEVAGLKGMLIEALRKQGKTAEVEQQLRALVQNDPEKLPLMMELSRHLHHEGKSDEALSIMHEFVAKHPEDVDAKLVLVQLIDVAKDVDQGDAALAAFIASEPTVYRLQYAQIDRQITRGKKDAAVATLETIVAKERTGNDAIVARNKLAALRVAGKDIAGAKALLEDVLAINAGDLDALSLRGRIAVAERRFTDAIGDLRTVVKERANDTAAAMLLASAHIENNEPELAAEILHRVVKLNPGNRKARAVLAELLQRQGKVEDATVQFKAILDKHPDDEVALLGLAKIYQAADDIDGLKHVAEKMLGTPKTMGAGFYYQGLIELQNKRNAEARELFEKALSLSKDVAVEPATAVIKSYLVENQWQKAVAWVDKKLQEKPDNSTLHNLKAEALMAGNDGAGAEKSLYKAIEKNPRWWAPYRTLSSLQLLRDDPSAAQKTLEQGIAATDKNPMLRMELALHLGRIGKVDESISMYQKMIAEGMNGDAVINNLAMLLSLKDDAKSLDDAKVYGERLARSDNPLYIDTAGWIHYRRAEYQMALPLLKKAADMAPQHAQIRYHLGVAYFKNNQLEEAKENLASALKDQRPFDGREEAQQILQQLQKG